MLSNEKFTELTSPPPFDPEVLGGSIKRKIVNPLLVEERGKNTFDKAEAFRSVWTQETRDEFEIFNSLVKKHPELNTDITYYELTREERFKLWWDRYKIIMGDPEFRFLFTNNSHKKSKYFSWYFMFAGTSPMTLHMQMFTKSIAQLGSEEQVRTILPKVNHWEIIGCYAQTELGHGSNVAGLETTATYDIEADQFVIHTPTIKAAKFWPGNLGVQATHAVVFARCISLECDYGVQPFIIQIRDLDTHEPFPGVSVGDIGTKLGYNSIDNGYLMFDQLRVPRKALLSRFMNITKTGDFKMKANPKIIYQIMVQTRITITYGCAMILLRASCIANRYAACRRQFATIKGSDDERKLLDYQLHQDMLAKHLCNSLTLTFVNQDLENMEKECAKDITNGSFKLLDILHHFSSGMKALATEFCYVGCDELRQACGGAGFLLSSGISDIWAEQGPFPTFEGVNVIMYQQSSRMLLKQASRVVQGKAPHDFFAYLADMETLINTPSGATTVEEFMQPEHLKRALNTRACFYIKKVHTMLTASKAPSKTKQNELFAIEVNRMVKLHLVAMMYMRACNKLQSKKIQDPNLVKVLMTVFANFALKQLSLDSAPLYESGFFGRGSSDRVDAAYNQTLIALRPDMVSLSEILPFGSTPSTIGNEYGDIYENQFETATQSRLNTGKVPELYHTHMKPVMKMHPSAKL